MKKNIKFLIILLVLIIGAFHIEPDDKELFMNLEASASPVRPNVVVLMGTAGTMNSIVFYPRYGLDGIANTSDDGFNPATIYTGEVDNAPTRINRTGWYARWIINEDGTINARQKSMSDLHNWDGKNFWARCYPGDGSPNNFRTWGNGWFFFRTGDKILFHDTRSPYYSAVATLKSKYIKDGYPWFELENIEGGPITPNGGYFQQAPDGQDWDLEIVQLYGTEESIPTGSPYNAPNKTKEKTRYDENYLKWLFLHASDDQRKAVSHFSTYGTFDTSNTPLPEEPNDFGNPDWEEWWLSDCSTDNKDRIKHRFTRIQVAREVICKVATVANEDINLGLFSFENSYGGYLLDRVNPSNDRASDLQAYKTQVYDKIFAYSWSPLAEALADIWNYYKPSGGDNQDYWPTRAKGVSDIQHWCQNNYVIVMSDGASTMDDFSVVAGAGKDGERFVDSIFASGSGVPVNRTNEYSSFEAWWDTTNKVVKNGEGWGDTDSNETSSGIPQNYDPANASYCPNWTCWIQNVEDPLQGTDYLDDVAYLLRHQDLFPDEYFGSDPNDGGWPGDQKIFTYTIGFNADHDLLRHTAINGGGAYYTASTYEELVDAFQKAITSIILRNFAFSAITAPKRTATTTTNDLTLSYVGYFMPAPGDSIWDGHLLAYELEDKWGFDADGVDGITEDEFNYDKEIDCLTASDGQPCVRWLVLSTGHQWDAADKLPDTRNLYTHEPDTTTNIAFTAANKATLKPLFFDEDKWGFDADGLDGVTADEYTYDTETECLAESGVEPCLNWLDNGCASCDTDADQVIEKLNQNNFADVFHSDVLFVGAPVVGKKYVTGIDPLDPDGEKYADFHENHKTRRRVLFAGTNDGILHMMNADDQLYSDQREAGKEVWGFIPDEVLLSLRKIAIDHDHTYTVDGRLAAEDIYYNQGSDGYPSWSTILVLGLRRGGNAYYALDITEYPTATPPEPSLLWKFKDDTYSGQSWGKPAIGKILIEDPDNSSQIIEKWVAVLPGGFAFNEENDTDLRGKAVFVVDASNGDLLWMTGYDPTGDNDASDNKFLTDSALFNFPIPSALTLVDKDNDGYVDSIYFGNLGGHLFKIDISGIDITQWTTSNLYQTDITTTATSKIGSISEDQITVGDKVFTVGERVRGQTSNAQGYIKEIDNFVLTVSVDAGTFIKDETIVTRSYDPIYLSPAVTYNRCFQIWVTIGTGDRDRPRTDPNKGHFIALRDDGSTDNLLTNLDDLSSYWNNGVLSIPEGEGLTAGSSGWYFEFPDDSEKLFDPEPLILPDENFVPHIIFNTYQPPEIISNPNQVEDPCNVPSEGIMKLYDLSICGCAIGNDVEQIEGENKTGRIAGGGLYHGAEYILYTSESGQVADVPGGNGGDGNFNPEGRELPYVGSIIYWKEKKR